MNRKLIIPNPENATQEELERAMRCSPSQSAAFRFKALHALLRGVDRQSVCLVMNVTERTLLEWIVRYNRCGIDGLLDEGGRGRKPKLTTLEIKEQILPVVDEPARAGQTHWTATKLHGFLKDQIAVEISYSTLVRYLHSVDYVRKIPRSWPQRQDEEKRQEFRQWLEQTTQDSKIELWFGDECGVEGDPRPRHRWVKKGSNPKIPYYGEHIRQSVVGAISPQTGQIVSLIVDGCDSQVFQVFLDTLAQEAPPQPGIRKILVLDNASWHKCKKLNWHHFQPKYLPPYSPDFNPIERFWLRLKADWFADFISKSPQELSDRLCLAIGSYLQSPSSLKSICAVQKP